MKIIYLCSKHPPLDGRIHYKIGSTLVKKGFSVYTINPNTEYMEKDGIKIIGYRQNSGIIGRIISLITLYYKGKQQNADFIIAPEPDSLVVAYLIKCFNNNVKVIFDCHEWYNLHFTHTAKIKNKTLAKILNKLVTLIMCFISRKIDAILTVNDTMTEFFKTYNSNSFTLPSLMEQSIIPDMKCKRKNYIFFGQFGGGNQEMILINAAQFLKKECSDAQIIVIGGYKSEEVNKFENLINLINNEQLQDNIKIEGWMAKDKAFSYLNTGLAGIMRFDTSYLDGFPALPNKLFEYMSMGMAIIGCELNSEIYKIVHNERCGVLTKTETGKELAESILYLQNNMEECLTMGKNSFNAVLERYNWDYYGDILYNIIYNIRKR